MATALKKEFDWYLANQAELIKKYNGKFLLIVGENVVGSFDSTVDAYNKGMAEYEPGKFLIQRCSSGNADYTATFHSRVSFPA
jgi:hypothetical protein